MNILLDQKEAQEIANSYQFLIMEKLGYSPYNNAIIHKVEPQLVNQHDYKVMVKAVYVVPPIIPELTPAPEFSEITIDLFDVIFIKRLPILFDIDDILLAKS